MKNSVKELSLTMQTYKSLKGNLNDVKIGKYVFMESIGAGAYGQVYKGMNDQTKKLVAIKILDLEKAEKTANQSVKLILRRLIDSQSKLMLMCNSENLIHCYDVFQNKSLKMMMIQFCKDGSLEEQINKKQRIPQDEAVSIIKQIINGIAELHRNKIVHRDLKSQNILIHNGIYKIADFGFSRYVKDSDSQINMTTLGTGTTMAPQVKFKKPYGLKADIWSIGAILFQMIFGVLPYQNNISLLYQFCESNEFLKSETLKYNGYTTSKQITTFLKQVLVIDSKKRLGWKELMNHELFKNSSGHLTNELRLDFNIKGPQDYSHENIQKKITVQDIIGQMDQKNVQDKFQKSGPAQRLSINQRMELMQTIDFSDDDIYQWARQTYVECLKTQLIYQQIIQPIKIHQLLDLQARETIELMYLLATRCKNNISVINQKLKKQKKEVVQKLGSLVHILYDKVCKIWDKYSNDLTQAQNKFKNIVKDKFTKIFKEGEIKTKDKFLVGIQTLEYTKIEQIQFTYANYIVESLQHIHQYENGTKINKIRGYLSHYRQINNIKLVDLEDIKFKGKVQKIINGQ